MISNSVNGDHFHNDGMRLLLFRDADDIYTSRRVDWRDARVSVRQPSCSGIRRPAVCLQVPREAFSEIPVVIRYPTERLISAQLVDAVAGALLALVAGIKVRHPKRQRFGRVAYHAR